MCQPNKCLQPSSVSEELTSGKQCKITDQRRLNKSNAKLTDVNNNSQENAHQSHEVMNINDEPGPCVLTLSGDQMIVQKTPIQEKNQRNVLFKVKMTFKPENKKHEIKSAKAQRTENSNTSSLTHGPGLSKSCIS